MKTYHWFQGLVIWRLISINLGSDFNLGFSIPLLKSLCGIIFSIQFRASNNHIPEKRGIMLNFFLKAFRSEIRFINQSLGHSNQALNNQSLTPKSGVQKHNNDANDLPSHPSHPSHPPFQFPSEPWWETVLHVSYHNYSSMTKMSWTLSLPRLKYQFSTLFSMHFSSLLFWDFYLKMCEYCEEKFVFSHSPLVVLW